MADSKTYLKITFKQPNQNIIQILGDELNDINKKNEKRDQSILRCIRSLQTYPIPLNGAEDCTVLRGFGANICSLLQAKSKRNPLRQQEDTIPDCISKKKPTIKSIPTAPTASQKRNAPLDRIEMTPGNYEIILLVDTQEQSWYNQRESNTITGSSVRRLSVSDFLWIARDTLGNELVLPYAIERKRMDDFAASICDGRFKEQKHRMRHIPNVIYLIEDYGGNQNLGIAFSNLQQAIVNTQIHFAFKITRSTSHSHSLQFLREMTEQIRRIYKNKTLVSDVDGDDFPFQNYKNNATTIVLPCFQTFCDNSSVKAKQTIRDVFVQQLLHQHSITLKKALALTAAYPTLHLLLTASDNDQFLTSGNSSNTVLYKAVKAFHCTDF